MAVYTKINKDDISFINKKFDIEEIISFQGIKKVNHYAPYPTGTGE